jgi:hypothetical protein
MRGFVLYLEDAIPVVRAAQRVRPPPPLRAGVALLTGAQALFTDELRGVRFAYLKVAEYAAEAAALSPLFAREFRRPFAQSLAVVRGDIQTSVADSGNDWGREKAELEKFLAAWEQFMGRRLLGPEAAASETAVRRAACPLPPSPFLTCLTQVLRAGADMLVAILTQLHAQTAAARCTGSKREFLAMYKLLYERLLNPLQRSAPAADTTPPQPVAAPMAISAVFKPHGREAPHIVDRYSSAPPAAAAAAPGSAGQSGEPAYMAVATHFAQAQPDDTADLTSFAPIDWSGLE